MWCFHKAKLVLYSAWKRTRNLKYNLQFEHYFPALLILPRLLETDQLCLEELPRVFEYCWAEPWLFPDWFAAVGSELKNENKFLWGWYSCRNRNMLRNTHYHKLETCSSTMALYSEIPQTRAVQNWHDKMIVGKIDNLQQVCGVFGCV